LRAVPNVYFENMFAKSMDVQSDNRRVDVECFLGQPATETPGALKLRVELRDSGKVLASETQEVKVSQGGSHLVSLTKLGNIELWGLENPKLYRVSAQLYAGETLVDEYSARIGFRNARFTPDGFQLNGQTLKLRGLNRHQTFPFVGAAMPARVQ